ncbi:RluA family pseudouridine synthase [Emcibacter sp. SYSU 3D8]|uniref:RluA family pseudouridine synthase n=1 Tax=Emcibacter sp. SYSU 3D8 TaxID=3133969 RepID=UPI0031FEAEC5
MSVVQTISVKPADADQRLDRWFKQHFPALSFGHLQKLLRTGQIRVGGKRAKADYRLLAGDQIRIPPMGEMALPMKKPLPAPPRSEDVQMLQDAVLYKDDHVIVINKPPGLAVQGGTSIGKHLDGMLEALRFGASDRPRLVHRLDKDTSGVLVLARSRQAAAALALSFKDRKTRKTYWALVTGVPSPNEGEITSMMEKDGEEDERVRPGDKGLKAITEYKVIENAGNALCWLALRPVTGRTHQLRVHCAQLGTPIISDGKYGSEDSFRDGISSKLHLHARNIVIPHPVRGTIDVTAPLPPHMRETWALFEFDPNMRQDVFADD